MPGLGAASRLEQHGTIEHSCVAALPCPIMRQGLSWQPKVVCMVVGMYGKTMELEQPGRTATCCSRDLRQLLATFTEPLAEGAVSIELKQLTSNELCICKQTAILAQQYTSLLRYMQNPALSMLWYFWHFSAYQFALESVNELSIQCQVGAAHTYD